MSDAAAEYRLVPLDCPSCGAAVAAEPEDVVYYCTACRNGYRFHVGEEALKPIGVSFVVAPQVATERYLPFWILPAEIEIEQREGSGGKGFSGLLSFFFTDGESETRSNRGDFVVPAFHAPLAAVTSLTRAYTQSLPKLGERLGERLLGGRYGVRDARKLAHYALIAGEVERPDTLERLRYRIRFKRARLLGVPFVRRGDGWADGIFGIAI